MQQEKTQLNKDEQAKLMELAGIMQLTYDLTRTNTIDWMLDKIPNGRREMKTLRTKSVRMFEKLCAVTPYKTLNAMQQTLKKIRCTIGVPLIGHETTHNAELGWVVSFDDLSTLTAGCKDMCMLCDKSGAERASASCARFLNGCLRRMSRNRSAADVVISEWSWMRRLIYDRDRFVCAVFDGVSMGRLCIDPRA